ncbi:MAG: crossover junction endodeoxyribonuclease RuvC [Phycisphaerae bacterium]
MMICGLDPGLHRTGYGIIEPGPKGAIKIIDAGLIRTDVSAPLPDRLMQLYDELSRLFDEHKLDSVAVEELYSHYAHPRTAILMGHARGVILLAARRKNLAIMNLSATKIKKALTGSGHAGKLQIQRAVLSRLHIKPGTQDIPADVTDALAIAVCCHEHLRSGLCQDFRAMRTLTSRDREGAGNGK